MKDNRLESGTRSAHQANLWGFEEEYFKHEQGSKGRPSARLPLGATQDRRRSWTKFLPRHMGDEQFYGIPVVTGDVVAICEVKKTF